MKPWEELDAVTAADGARIELRRRGHEFLIRAGGHDLMSSEDDQSSMALAELGCAHMQRGEAGRVLVGGLGMGFTLRAALEHTDPAVRVVCAELNDAVVRWNRGPLADLAGRPLEDPRAEVVVEDVLASMRHAPSGGYQAILLDVDNGPDALAHDDNDALYGRRGIEVARGALAPGGSYCVWSFSDDPAFTRRLERAGFAPVVHRVKASRKGRGRYHYIWVARPGTKAKSRRPGRGRSQRGLKSGR